jgi:hypothetical protein
MHVKDAFELRSVEAARAIVRAHPFATIVTRDLRATHMPCLVDEDAEGLAILSHVAKTDPASAALDGPVLMMFHGPHGFVSASWYGDASLTTKPRTFASSARRRVRGLAVPLRITVRQWGSSSCSLRAAESPSTAGIPMSKTTTSGFTRRAAGTIDSMRSISATTLMSSSPASSATSAPRINAMSSASRTRMTASVPFTMAGPPPFGARLRASYDPRPSTKMSVRPPALPRDVAE